MRRKHTIQRLETRVKGLIKKFGHYVDVFDKAFDQKKLFRGPSIYFHNKTLEIRHRYAEAVDVVDDDLFFDYLYATLTAWGLHRMGDGVTKLEEIDKLKVSFRKQKKLIQVLQSFEIDTIQDNKVFSVTLKLWHVVANVKVGEGKTKIVGGSKALHHLVPNLLPPIDGQYTFKFFFDGRETALNQGDKSAFMEIYPYFRQIARVCVDEIKHYTGYRMNTSKTKVIDNAIIGFVLKELS